MPSAVRVIDIAVPCDFFMDLLTDFSSYPTFLPDMKRAEVLKATSNSWEVAFTLQVIRPLSYTLRLRRPSPFTLQWSMVEGLFRSNSGQWLLESAADDCTTARYEIDVQVGMFVPGNILQSLLSRNLPQTLQCFRDEAQRRFARG